MTVVAAIARMDRIRAIINESEHLEQLAISDTIAFDKTGALTEAARRRRRH